MELELGKSYLVQKADGTTVSFKFIGNDPDNPQALQVEINGEIRNIYDVLKGGYLAYWQVDYELN